MPIEYFFLCFFMTSKRTTIISNLFSIHIFLENIFLLQECIYTPLQANCGCTFACKANESIKLAIIPVFYLLN